MKCRWLGLCVVVVLVAVPAQAGKPFDEGSLLGTYAFTETHVRDEGGTPVFCSGYGTMTFHGDGTVYVDKHERCSDDSVVKNEPEDLFYAVGIEPFFYIKETPVSILSTQCQLLQKGSIILCDGTPREDEMYSLHVVGVKR